MLKISSNFYRKNCHTCFSSGDDSWSARGPPSDTIHSNHVHFVFSVGAQVPHRIVHGNDTAYFAKRLISVFWFELDNVILKVFGAWVCPRQPHRSCRYF